MGVAFSADWNGRPMAALDRALSAMQEHLNRTPKQAVSAMAINVLKGVRARTAVAKWKKAYTVKPAAGLVPGFRRNAGVSIRTVRVRGGHSIPQWRATGTARAAKDWSAQTVFSVAFPQRADMPGYYLVAADKADAKTYVETRLPALIYRGLARRALGIAMAKIAAGSGMDGVTAKAEVAASKLVSVSQPNDGAIIIRDALDYAKLAVKGGEAGMNAAVDAAVNKVMGQIKHKIHEQLRKEGFSV